MPSRADDTGRNGLRVWLERAGQALAAAIIVFLLLRALAGRDTRATSMVEVGDLRDALARWSTVAAPEQVHVRVDTALGTAHRDWLVALTRSGTRVTWEGEGIPPVAAVADAIADPAGGTLIRAAAPAATMVVLADEFGVVDSIPAGAAGARFLAHSGPADVRVRAGPLVARSMVLDSLILGRLLVIGSVGWEGKFVVAALEERGWRVDARLALSPKGHVEQGSTSPIDTSRYAAVIVLDNPALANVSGLSKYVRDGGGLVVAARSSTASGLGSFGVGTLAKAVDPIEPFDADAAEPRRALALTPIVPRADAIPLEQRDALVAVAARRVGRGRVAVVGYDDTWRWRMGGGPEALERHRAWWAGIVAAVARAGRIPRMAHEQIDEAPLAHLFDRLGPPSAAPVHVAGRGGLPPAWLFALLAVSVLGAWLSRRLRGAP